MQITKHVIVTVQLAYPEETISLKVGSWQVDVHKIEWVVGKDFAEVHGLQMGYPRSGHVLLSSLPVGVAELFLQEVTK